MAWLARKSRRVPAHAVLLAALRVSWHREFKGGKERGVVYMLLMVGVHGRWRRVELLRTGGHDSLRHGGRVLAGQRVSGDRAGSRRLVEGRSAAAALVHAASSAVAAKVLVVRRVAHGLAVVLGSEVRLSTSSTATTLVSATAGAVSIVVTMTRSLRVPAAVRHGHGILRNGGFVHLALGGEVS